MRTALVDLTGESRTTPVYASDWPHPEIALHKQALSFGGLLNIPDIGQEFEFSGEKDVTTAIGIAVAQSYRLIGEAELPEDSSSVTEVRNALEHSQALALDATLLTARIAELRSSDDAGSERTVEQIDKLERRRSGVEQELREARECLRRVANQPGIIIARWSTDENTGGALGTYGLGVALATEEGRSGFIILGGLRVVSLVFGEDFWWLLNNLRSHEKPYVEQVGITTQLIQAQDVAYTSDLLLRRVVRLSADLRSVSGASVAAAQIDGYWSFLGQYANSGNLPRITWRREPFCAVCSLDLPGLARPEHQSLQKLFEVHEKKVDPASYQGWRTISANITYLRDAYVLFFRVFGWTDHAEDYAKERIMYPAPACPFCGGNEDAVRIRNPGALEAGETGPSDDAGDGAPRAGSVGSPWREP